MRGSRGGCNDREALTHLSDRESLGIKFSSYLCIMASSGQKLISNWLFGISFKMYFDMPSTEAYLTAMSTAWSTCHHSSCNIFVLLSLPALLIASSILSSTIRIWIGAQNCHGKQWRAYGRSTTCNAQTAGLYSCRIWARRKERRTFQ